MGEHEIDPLVGWNLTLFGQFARRGAEPRFPDTRRAELLPLFLVWRHDFQRGQLPWQLRETSRRHSHLSPVVNLPKQRSRTAAEAEDRLFNHFPKSRPPRPRPAS